MSRELDEWIHINVMGHVSTGAVHMPVFIQMASIPHYSTDIAAAWEVVEKIKPDGFSLTYDVCYGVDKKAGWTVIINGSIYPEFCDSPAKAICLAAKKAFENK